MTWGELGDAVANGHYADLDIEELASMICRTQTIYHLHWLGIAFAMRSEVALWMHTMLRALKVLTDERRLTEFIDLHFLEFTNVDIPDSIMQYVVTTEKLFCITRAYKERGDRAASMLQLGNNMGDHRYLLPQSSAEAELTPR